MGTATKEKTPKGKGTYNFWTTGEGMTNLIRDSWVSDTPKHALSICRDSLGMSTEQALEVITGKKKLIGDTREGDGTLGWADDNTTQVSGIELSVEVMITRLENKWININEAINTFNAVNEDLESEFDFSYTMKTLNGYKNQLPKVLDELQEVYSIVGKTMKDLPIDKVRSAQKIKEDYRKANPEEFKPTERLVDFETRLSKSLGGSKNILDNMLDGIKKEKEAEKKYDKNDINRPFHTGIGGGTFYIVHCDTKKCKAENLHAGWLLPDGTYFGGDSIWIHRGILDELQDRKWFKGKKYTCDEDSVQEDGGWIKFSGGTWFIWEHKHKLTKEQVEFIIQYTTEVDERTFLKVGTSSLIHVTVFAKILNGEQFDEWEMTKESEPIIATEIEARNSDSSNELANFPTIQEVSEIDLLSTPFFQPDVAFVKWIISYANGRMIIDCGAGSGYLTAMIQHLGYKKCIAIEPQYTEERNIFWHSKGFHFHVFFKPSEEEKIINELPKGDALLIFARPCHNGFVYRTIKNNMPEGSEALYISHKGNEMDDLGDIEYTKLKHNGTSKSNEYVLSIKK